MVWNRSEINRSESCGHDTHTHTHGLTVPNDISKSGSLLSLCVCVLGGCHGCWLQVKEKSLVAHTLEGKGRSGWHEHARVCVCLSARHACELFSRVCII